MPTILSLRNVHLTGVLINFKLHTLIVAWQRLVATWFTRFKTTKRQWHIELPQMQWWWTKQDRWKIHSNNKHRRPLNVFTASSHTVCVYDNMYARVKHSLVIQVSSLLRGEDAPDKLELVFQPFQQLRHGTRLCGFDAIAAYVSCVLQHDQAGQVYNEELTWYDDLVGRQRVRLFPSVKCDQLMPPTSAYVDKLHCVCYRASSASWRMVQCTKCANWFHMHTWIPEPASPGTLARLHWLGPCCSW